MITLLASTSWAPFFQTAIGALIGAGGAITGGAFGSWFTWQKERQSVAAALAGEVPGVINVINLRDACEGLLQGRTFPIDEHPFLVFEANVGKIGLLPVKLAGTVAEFYSIARGIVQDFRTIHKGDFPDKFSETEFRQSLVKNIQAMIPIAEALISELREEAAKTWKDYLQPG
jgi:hypothetical protein